MLPSAQVLRKPVAWCCKHAKLWIRIIKQTSLCPFTGQAFAKHYNPLLSGETSHGSQHSSDKTPNAVPLKRLGEAPQPNSQGLPSLQQSSEHDSHTATSQYTAPSSQAMHAPHSANTPATAAQQVQLQELDNAPVDKQGVADVRSGTSQGASMQRTASKGVTDQGIAGKLGASQPSRGLKVEAGKQLTLGRQLGDALKLRNWKPNRQAGSGPPVNDISTKPVLSLSPRTESAMMAAASELGFDARQAGSFEPSAQPTLPLAAQSYAEGSVLAPLTP